MENVGLAIIVIVLLTILIYFALSKKTGLEELPESKWEIFENDAKRMARILIAEIKLYENYKVQKGLKNNNLYESLQDEIEVARNKYKKRFTHVELDRYFDDALVEVLADGDKSKLGQVSPSLNK